MRIWTILIAFLLCLSACMPQNKTELEPPPRLDPMANPNWTAEERAAYEKCLEESIMVAMAWEVIQQQCRDSVNRTAEPLSAR